MNREIARTQDKLLSLSADERAREEALMRQKALSDYASDMDDAKEEGRIECEVARTLEIAKNMVAEGLSIHLISQLTRLTVEEVALLKEQKG